jgi:hypothetical protein
MKDLSKLPIGGDEVLLGAVTDLNPVFPNETRQTKSEIVR